MSRQVPGMSSIRVTALLGGLMVLAGVLFLRLDLTIRSDGIVHAHEEIHLFAPRAGVLEAIPVEVGQQVEAGELLISLQETDLLLRLAEAGRFLAGIEAELEATRIALRELNVRPGEPDLISAPARTERLERIAAIQQEIEADYAAGRQQQIISDLEVRRQQIERLRAELDALQAGLLAEWQRAGLSAFEVERLHAEERRLLAVAALARGDKVLLEAQRVASQIRAPIRSQLVALPLRFAGMAVEAGTEVAVLADISSGYLIKALVPERNIDLLRPGARALMQSAVSGAVFEDRVEGHVLRVAPAADATASAEEPRFEVEIEVPASTRPLVLGSRVDLTLYLGRRSLTDRLRGEKHVVRQESAHE